MPHHRSSPVRVLRLLLTLLIVVAVQAEDVGRWARFERALTNSRAYADPLRSVTLNVTYTKPDGSTKNFWGFWDGGSTWRIRYMPDMLGTWSFNASFSDGSPGLSGSFTCVASTIPGMVSADAANPKWLGYAGGGGGLFRAFHGGPPLFKSSFSAPARDEFLDWAQTQKYNLLSVNDFQGTGFPKRWPIDPANYRQMEGVLDDLAARRIIYYPFGGFFPNESEDRPSAAADATLLIRYYLARFGPYWNLILNVAGFEAEAFLSDATIRSYGSQIASLDPFGHLLGVHQLNGDDAFRNDSWNSFTTLQHEITDLAALGTYLRRHHDANQPVFAQETVWMGNTLQPAWTLTDLRKQMWVHMMSATTLCVGDMAGNNMSGFSGSLLLADRVQARHDVPKRIWDFMESIPFQRMSPAQSVVSSGFALAETGQRYLVYLPSGGTVDVAVASGTYSVTWVHAADPAQTVPGGSTSTGQDLSTPDGNDWVLHLVRTGSGGTVPPPPAGEADLISAASFVGQSSGWSTTRGVARAHDGSTATEAWADTAAEVWLEYAFSAPHTLTRARVYDDNAGNHEIGQWRMQYLVGTTWTEAVAATASTTVGWSEAPLSGITATRVRVLCQAPAGVFLELREFECYGVPAGTPAPGGTPLLFEAEDAARVGVTVASTHAGFTGRGYGDYDGSAGSSITWTVNLPTAGVYLLDLRYANGGTTNRALALSVNGTSMNPGLAMPVTGGWTTWFYSADEEVILPAGTSTIRASAVSAGPNVDHLRLTPAPSGGG